MKQKGRILSLLMAFCLLFVTVSGCAGNNAGSSATNPPASSGSSTTTTDNNTASSDTSTATTEGATESATASSEVTPIVSGYDFTACIASEPETIDPAINSAVDGAVMMGHLFEGLMKWADDGSGNTVNAKLVNGQAESYEKTMDGDKAVYTFKLRNDIKWSDGKEVTANDFEYAWKRLITPETAADYNYMIDMVENANEIMSGEKDPSTLGVRAIDSKTLEITLFYDCPYFLEVCAFPATFPVRSDIIAANGDQWTFSPDTYITNGTYKMASWTHNAEIVMEKNIYHYDYANLGPDKITFKLMDDENAMYAGFRSGELDFIEQMPIDEIPKLKESGELTIGDYIGTYYINFQTQKAPFDDARVRKALSLVIDRNYIVENITRTGQAPASGYVPSGIYDAAGPGSDFRETGGEFYSVDPAKYQANCDEARALLAEAGYPNGEGFPVVEYTYNTNANHKAIGEALQQMWKTELNINVTLANEEWSTFLDTRQQGNYDIARNGWIGDYNDPITFIDMFETGNGNNAAQYTNAQVDEQIRIAKSSSDPAVRYKAMHTAENIFMGESAVAPVYFYTIYWLLNPNAKGMYYTPLGYMFFSYIKK